MIPINLLNLIIRNLDIHNLGIRNFGSATWTVTELEDRQLGGSELGPFRNVR